ADDAQSRMPDDPRSCLQHQQDTSRYALRFSWRKTFSLQNLGMERVLTGPADRRWRGVKDALLYGLPPCFAKPACASLRTRSVALEQDVINRMARSRARRFCRIAVPEQASAVLLRRIEIADAVKIVGAGHGAGRPLSGNTGAVQIQHQVLDGTGGSRIIFTRDQLIVALATGHHQPAGHFAPAFVLGGGSTLAAPGLDQAGIQRDDGGARLLTENVEAPGVGQM